jgi:hypothetical protein
MKTRHTNEIKDARMVARMFGAPGEDTIWRSTKDGSIVGAQFGKLFVSIHQWRALASGKLKLPRGSKSMCLLFSVIRHRLPSQPAS